MWRWVENLVWGFVALTLWAAIIAAGVLLSVNWYEKGAR